MTNVTSTAAKPMTKTAFVLSQPSTLTAQEVVDRAKAAGIDISAGVVYAFRSIAKRAGQPKAKAGAPKAAKAAPAKKAAAAPKAKAAAPAPAAKATRKPAAGGVSKRQVVESLPASLSAAQVVTEAKKQGVTVSENYVYKLRRANKKAGAKGAPKAVAPKAAAAPVAKGKAAKAKAPAKAAAKAPAARSNDKGAESRLIDAALGLGFAKAGELLEKLRSKLKGLAV